MGRRRLLVAFTLQFFVMHGHVIANGVHGGRQESVILPFCECVNLMLSWSGEGGE